MSAQQVTFGTWRHPTRQVRAAPRRRERRGDRLRPRGRGGYPLLLVHGWPETRRIWWRNIAELAAAGFEVIAPDLRGFGDSGLAPDDRYDAAAHARDMEALVRGTLGHERCVVVRGRPRAASWPRTCRCASTAWWSGWSCSTPSRRCCPTTTARPASRRELPREVRQAADYFMRQSRDADGLAAELDTPRAAARVRGPDVRPALLGGARGVRRRGRRLHDRAVRRTPSASGHRSPTTSTSAGRAPRPSCRGCSSRNPTPALVLYGPEDHVIPRDFPRRMEVAFPEIVGPFEVAGAGHFLMWERRACAQPCDRGLLPRPPGTIARRMSDFQLARGRAGGPAGRADRGRRPGGRGQIRAEAEARGGAGAPSGASRTPSASAHEASAEPRRS